MNFLKINFLKYIGVIVASTLIFSVGCSRHDSQIPTDSPHTDKALNIIVYFINPLAGAKVSNSDYVMDEMGRTIFITPGFIRVPDEYVSSNISDMQTRFSEGARLGKSLPMTVREYSASLQYLCYEYLCSPINTICPPSDQLKRGVKCDSMGVDAK